MTQKLLDLDQENELDNSEIGRRYLFLIERYSFDKMFSFSSTLENIGDPAKHDCKLKNNSIVLVLSDPIEAFHPNIGKFLVNKILANCIMWVPSNTLKLIADNDY